MEQWVAWIWNLTTFELNRISAVKQLQPAACYSLLFLIRTKDSKTKTLRAVWQLILGRSVTGRHADKCDICWHEIK